MNVKNEHVTVVGMGKTSLALVRLLLREGAIPFVTDADKGALVEPHRAALEELGVRYECGGHTEEAFARASIVIPSPGVPPGIEPIAEAAARGARVLGEMEFAYGYCRSRIIAVTGTNGKTTTTELIRDMVAACGHSVELAGNNDEPFSAAVVIDPPPEYIVLEVSSYQLELAKSFQPWIGVVLNLTEDHLQRHRTMEGYAATKARLFANQTEGDIAVINGDDPWCKKMVEHCNARVIEFSRSRRVEAGLWLDGDTIREGDAAIANVSDIPLPGEHNIENVMAALTAMRTGEFDSDAALKALRAFAGVEHRLEYVESIAGVRYVNDSKATNLDSLRVALESFDEPVVLIAGGRGKGGDYRALTDDIQRYVSTLVAMGEDAPLLEAAFGSVVSVICVEGMADAVFRASLAARGEGTVLLSPGCASFDQYANFEERGRAFKDAVATTRSDANLGKGTAV